MPNDFTRMLNLRNKTDTGKRDKKRERQTKKQKRTRE